MVAAPGATAVTTPVPETVATLGADVPYVTLTTGAPLGCDTVGVNACVWPTVRVAELGDTVTPVIAAGSADTVIVAVPCTPSTVAVIVAFPTATAVTSPVVLTEATAAFDVDQVTARPVNALPPASRAAADSCCVPPTSSPAVAGVTCTVAAAATDTATVAVDVAAAKLLLPDAVAVTVIVALPGATAVTTPAVDTVATLGADVP